MVAAEAPTFEPLGLQACEAAILAPRDKPAMADWAEEHWFLPAKVASHPGRWSRVFTPYLVPIMEAITAPSVRFISILKANQIAGTELVNIAIGYWIDCDPAPTMVVMPTEDLVKDRLAYRLKPTFQASERMMRHLGGDITQFNIGKATEFDTMNLFIAWANSPATLEDKPICNMVLDEVALFPAQAGGTTSPRRLAAMRQTTYSWRSKLIALGKSFYAHDPADEAYRAGDQREYFVPCPKCGHFHIMATEHIQIAKRKDRAGQVTPFYEAAEYLEDDGPRVAYRCPHCRKSWTEAQRWAATQKGLFLPAGCTIDKRGRIEGDAGRRASMSFRITGLMAYPGFLSVRQLAAEWVEAQVARRSGDIEPLKNYFTAREAQPWVETAKQTPEDALLKHVDDSYEMGFAPEGVLGVTLGFDVQLDHVWVAVYGWGYLFEGWLLWAGRIETGDTRQVANFQPLTELIGAGIPTAADPGKRLAVVMASGDSAYHRDAVTEYAWTVQDKGLPVVAARGSEHVTQAAYKAFRAPVQGKGNAKRRRDPRTIIRYDVNVNAFKDALYRGLYENQIPGPGYLHLPKDVTEDIRLQLSSEEQRTIRVRGKEKHIWVLKKGRANHLLDASVHARLAAELANFRWIRPGGQTSKPVGKPLARRPIRTRY